jgi:dTMP kinase
MAMKSGLFITLEGPDGSGQSTQTDLLTRWLEKKDQKVFATKEPTNSMVGGIIRVILKKEWKVNPVTFALLFAADRAHHVNKEIKPLLKKNVHVISDRYILSTLAFESNGVNLEWLKLINERFPKPDLTFILDVPGKICTERIRKSRFGFEYFETPEKLENVRKNYLKLKDYFPNTYVIKGYNRSKKEIHNEIKEIVKKFCKENNIQI